MTSTVIPSVTPSATRRRIRSLAGIAAATTLLLSACGGSDDAASDPADEVVAEGEQDATESAGVVETAPVDVSGEPLPQYTDPENDAAVGLASPVFSGVGFDGTPITIGEPTDNLTFAVFLAHWCPACQAEVPELVELSEAGTLPDGVDVVAVSTAVADDRDSFPPSEWLGEEGWPFDVMVDSADAVALEAVGATSFPFMVVLDTDGTVLARKTGQATAEETIVFLDGVLASAST